MNDAAKEVTSFSANQAIFHENFKFTKKYNGQKHYTYWCVFNRSRNDTCTAKLKVNLLGKIISVEGEHSETCQIKNDKKNAKLKRKSQPKVERVVNNSNKRTKVSLELPDIVIQVKGAGADEINGYYYPYSGNGKSHGWPVFSKFSSSLGYYYLKYFGGSWRICGAKEFTYQVDYYVCERNERSDIPPCSGWKIPTKFLYRQASFAPHHSFDQDDSKCPGVLPVPTITVASFTNNESLECSKTNAKMLFSEKFSDVHFLCPGGAMLHAHRIVLSAASDYFSAIFEGDWADEHPDGKWEIPISENLMRIILTHIYTCDTDTEEISEYPLEIISLAHEYQLTKLVEKAEQVMTEKIDEFNVKQALQIAVLHDLDVLKESCFQFIKGSTKNIVMDKGFMELSTKDEALWDELRSYLY